jgi:GxxExxY protein
MVCSNCKQEGHTKAKCQNPKYEPPAKTTLDNPDVPITLPEPIRVKLNRLSSLCIEVAAGLGKGQVEGVYQQALCFELQDAGIKYVSEETMPILYKGRPVGGGHSQRLDIVLSSYLPFIFELKATPKMTSANHWQLVRYMIYKGLNYGAVVNFNQSDKGPLEIQFIVYHEGNHYLYDYESQTGVRMVDFGLAPKRQDEWEEAWE